MSNPVLKGGLNYQYIAFKTKCQRITLARKFNAVELFMEILKIVEAKSWFYNANLATGFQFIEDNSKQWTYRVQAKFGYKSDRLLHNVYGTRSNIAPLLPQGLP
jgi:hypothetical protein